jgi:hypothetical protein
MRRALCVLVLVLSGCSAAAGGSSTPASAVSTARTPKVLTYRFSIHNLTSTEVGVNDYERQCVDRVPEFIVKPHQTMRGDIEIAPECTDQNFLSFKIKFLRIFQPECIGTWTKKPNEHWTIASQGPCQLIVEQDQALDFAFQRGNGQRLARRSRP